MKAPIELEVNGALLKPGLLSPKPGDMSITLQPFRILVNPTLGWNFDWNFSLSKIISIHV